MAPTLVVLAAGMGSRYGSLKQVDKLGPHGETIIDYSVFDAIKAGFGKVVFVIRKSIEKDFLEVFANRFLARIPYQIVFQELDMLPRGFVCPPQRTKPWGTVHALWVCRDVVKEPFVVINADDFYGEDAYKKLALHLENHPGNKSSDYAMCGYQLAKTLSDHGSVTRGICKTDDSGYLVSVDEHLNIRKDESGKIISRLPSGEEFLDPDTIVSMNIWAFNPGIFPLIEEHLMEFLKSEIQESKSEMFTPKLVDKLIRKNQGKVKVLQSNAQWFGVTYAEDKEIVSKSLRALTQQQIYPAEMWK